MICKITRRCRVRALRNLGICKHPQCACPGYNQMMPHGWLVIDTRTSDDTYTLRHTVYTVLHAYTCVYSLLSKEHIRVFEQIETCDLTSLLYVVQYTPYIVCMCICVCVGGCVCMCACVGTCVRVNHIYYNT